MTSLSVDLLGLRVFLSAAGLLGNVCLFGAIVRNGRVKSYDLFLLGLAVANTEEIVMVNIYNVLRTSSTNIWVCRTLQSLVLVGENTSIFITVLIGVFRYQKLRDANQRRPIFLDDINVAWLMSAACFCLSLLVSTPALLLNPVGPPGNDTQNRTGCPPPDHFHCSEDHCPVLHRFYKYVFITSCNLVPLVVVTVSSCLIIAVLLRRRKTVAPVGAGRRCRKRNVQRSTLAVLAAMLLFQVDWILYLVFQLMVDPSLLPVWAEMKFFISTSYTSISPYVYGIGSSLFTVQKCTLKVCF